MIIQVTKPYLSIKWLHCVNVWHSVRCNLYCVPFEMLMVLIHRTRNAFRTKLFNHKWTKTLEKTYYFLDFAYMVMVWCITFRTEPNSWGNSNQKPNILLNCVSVSLILFASIMRTNFQSYHRSNEKVFWMHILHWKCSRSHHHRNIALITIR